MHKSSIEQGEGEVRLAGSRKEEKDLNLEIEI